MGYSPYLTGAIAAQARMEDARREAEQRRLAKTVGSTRGFSRSASWLARLASRLRRPPATPSPHRPAEPGFRPPRSAHGV